LISYGVVSWPAQKAHYPTKKLSHYNQKALNESFPRTGQCKHCEQPHRARDL